jgi:hypothetical protein
MAAQPFDPTALANALKNLGAASNITEKLKSDWADISKNLSEQEKNQRRLNVLTNLQSDIASIISEQKKASIVYDEASFNLEKRKLELQQEIYQAQMKRIDEEISAGILTRDQLQAAESFKNNLLMQKIALDGNLKVYEKQKDEGKKIEDQFKLVNDQLIQERKNISDVNIDLVATSKISKLIGDIMSELKIPASFSSLLKQTYERFKEIDKTATEVRQTFALFRQDAEYIEKNIKNISTDLAKFGVAAKDVASTSKSIGSAFSSIDIANTSLVSDITLLSKQMGITSDRSVGFLKTIGGIKGQSAVANKNMLGLAGASAKAYGVGLDDVMADVANASEEARMYAGKNADEMVRAAAQARQMGTTLDNMSRTAKGLLDFESSIQAELKASALIGKNINFNEARRLAFQGKVVEANKLILDQAKKIKFNQLNPIAQEAFAKAAGKSVKELQDMLEAETRIKDALNSQDPVVRKIAQERLKEQNLLKTNSKLAQQKFEQDLKTKANQERLAIVQNKINDALQKLMLPVLEFISKTMDGIVYIFEKFNPEELIGPLIRIKLMFTSVGTALRESLLLPLRVASGYLSKLGEVGWIKNLLLPITMLIEKTKLFIGNFQYVRSLGTNFAQSFLSAGNAVGGIFSKIGKVLSALSVPIDFVISKFNIFKTFVSSIFSPITNAIKPIIGAFKSVGEGSKFLKPLLGFLKIGKVGLTAVPILGEIIMAIEFIYNAWKRISVIFNDPNLNIGQKIFASVVGLYGALYDTLIQPFIDIGEWIIKAVWGEDILKGIKAVVNDIYTILKSPFEKAYNWIMDLLGGKSPSKIGLAIVDGIESVVDMLFGVITYPFKKAAQIIPEIINILKTTFVDAFKSAMDAMFDVITYPFKKGFELIKSAVSEVGTFLKDTFSGAFTFIIGALEKVWEKMKGIGSFISDTIGKTFSFVGRIVGVSEETPSKTATESKTSVKTDDLLINTIVNSNRVLAEKLDKLTSMMASGQIAVYIDGQRANQLLATSNSKFGSFGQATTN